MRSSRIGSSIARFFTGDLSQRTMRFVVVPLIVVCFFGSTALAVALLPQDYDWRVMSISQLLYPRVNPDFHFIPAMGLAVTGVLLLPFAGYVRRRLGFDSPVVRTGATLFAGGAICLILASAITSHPLHGRATVPQLHAILGRAAGVGLGSGILLFEFYALRQRYRARNDSVSRRLVLWWSLITWPVIVVLLSRLIIGLHFQVLGPLTRSLKQSAMWHLGFWEWIGSVAVVVFLAVSTWLLPATNRDDAA